MTASGPAPHALRLGVNIDHVATIRNARGGDHPDPVRAAEIVAAVGGDGITAHLREDRRHIRDGDLSRIQSATGLPLNLEMAATEEMLAIALSHAPHAACIVPEKREERTTEGGLDVVGGFEQIASACQRLAAAGCDVSLFIDPDESQIDAAHRAGAPTIELHTGAYADAKPGSAEANAEYDRLSAAAVYAVSLGLVVNAGHGLHYHNAEAIAALPGVNELNIGHAIIARALFVGLKEAVQEMKRLIIAGQEAGLMAALDAHEHDHDHGNGHHCCSH